MSSHRRTLFFAALLCMVCSFLLTAANTGLKGFQRRNVELDKQVNILKSVGLVEPGRKRSEAEVAQLYGQHIRAVRVDRNGQIMASDTGDGDGLPVYLFVQEAQLAAYIVPIDSRGLWGRIKGYLAIEADGSTVSGFTVFKHSETPGLGAEIEKQWFQKNFKGKKIVTHEGDFVAIAIAKGAVEQSVPVDQQPHYVDGISGATLTGKYLTAGLRDILYDYEPVAIRFRRNMGLGSSAEVSTPEKQP